MSPPKPATLDAVFALLVECAVAKKRCPQNATISDHVAGLGLTHGSSTVLTTPLAEQGRIYVEVYTHNWRVVEIRQGPHTGARTEECPHKNNGPYLVFPSQKATLRRLKVGRSRGRHCGAAALPPLPDFRT